MYAALWYVLPGPWWVRMILVLLLAAAVVYGLFFHLFPWIAAMLVDQEATVGG